MGPIFLGKSLDLCSYRSTDNDQIQDVTRVQEGRVVSGQPCPKPVGCALVPSGLIFLDALLTPIAFA